MALHEEFLEQAVALARENMERSGGRPFGALLVRHGEVLATGINEIGATGDPTAHAELQAIRAACQAIGAPRLDGCIIYASGQPCPMCLSAMYLTGVSMVYYAFSNEEGAPYGLSTAPIYAELQKPLTAQALQIRHLPLRGSGPEELYGNWARRQKAD